MRICQVISDSNVGGAGILLSSVAKSLEDSFDMDIIIPKGSRLAERLDFKRARIIEAPFRGEASFRASDILRFSGLLRGLRPDLLHTHAALSARLAGRLIGIPACISTRHCAYSSLAEGKRSRVKRKIYDFCTDLTVSTADYATKNLLSEGVPKDKIITIKNGVMPTKVCTDEEKAALLRELRIPIGAKIIGSVARLEDVKGQDLIIRALSHVRRSGIDAYAIFVGDGSYRELYEMQAASLGLLPFVRFVGYVSEPYIYQNIFTVNVNASRGTETSCLASSEAMSLGIPSVVSDFGGNTEMFIEGVNGLFFPSGNAYLLAEALAKLLSDPHLLKRLSCGAKRIFEERFSLSRMAADYLAMYSKFSK